MRRARAMSSTVILLTTKKNEGYAYRRTTEKYIYIYKRRRVPCSFWLFACCCCCVDDLMDVRMPICERPPFSISLFFPLYTFIFIRYIYICIILHIYVCVCILIIICFNIFLDGEIISIINTIPVMEALAINIRTHTAKLYYIYTGECTTFLI